MMRLKNMLRMVFSAALLLIIAVAVTVALPSPCNENSTFHMVQGVADTYHLGRTLRVPLPDPTSTFVDDLPGVREVRLFNFTTTCSFFV